MSGRGDKLEAWGERVDRETWRSLCEFDDDALVHGLWCAVGRAVARGVLRRRGVKCSDEECPDDDLLHDWLWDSLPTHSGLAWVLGEYDYFRDLGQGWEESLTFAGNACPFPHEVVDDLRQRLDHSPDAAEAITLTAVECFYAEWRSRFLRRILDEASRLAGASER